MGAREGGGGRGLRGSVPECLSTVRRKWGDGFIERLSQHQLHQAKMEKGLPARQLAAGMQGNHDHWEPWQETQPPQCSWWKNKWMGSAKRNMIGCLIRTRLMHISFYNMLYFNAVFHDSRNSFFILAPILKLSDCEIIAITCLHSLLISEALGGASHLLPDEIYIGELTAQLSESDKRSL